MGSVCCCGALAGMHRLPLNPVERSGAVYASQLGRGVRVGGVALVSSILAQSTPPGLVHLL